MRILIALILLLILLTACEEDKTRTYLVRIVSVQQSDQAGDDWTTTVEYTCSNRRELLNGKLGEVNDLFTKTSCPRWAEVQPKDSKVIN